MQGRSRDVPRRLIQYAHHGDEMCPLLLAKTQKKALFSVGPIFAPRPLCPPQAIREMGKNGLSSISRNESQRGQC